jgi:glucan phosphorylase
MSKFLDDHFKIIHVTKETALEVVATDLAAEYGISPSYAELVETANLDWQVAQYVNLIAKAHEHSANEVKAAYILAVATEQHGLDTVTTAINNY